IKLAWGRSGDKGNKANIGIIARHAAYLPYIWAALDEDAIRHRFGHFMAEGSDLQRFYLPGSNAMNILIDEALGGGGVASLRNDPQGKAYAQILLDHKISIPEKLAEAL
ncbi:MAG: AtuA-related protein, partial [Parvibaculales bacterium]